MNNSEGQPKPKADKDHNQRRPIEPLITRDWGPIAAAAITAAVSLLIFVAGQVRHIDERLDQLEREASVLLDGNGTVKPSREALENKYHLEALSRRVERLENK